MRSVLELSQEEREEEARGTLESVADDEEGASAAQGFEMILRLKMDFRSAGQEGSDERICFMRDLKQDLAHASGMCVCVCVCVCVYIHTYIHIYIYIHRPEARPFADASGMETSDFNIRNIRKVSAGSVLVELDANAPGTQFTCFTSTKVQILTPEALLLQRRQRTKFRGSHSIHTHDFAPENLPDLRII